MSCRKTRSWQNRFSWRRWAQRKEADPLLQQLFKDVLASPAASELLEMVLNRLAGQPAAQNLPMFFGPEAPLRVVEVIPSWPLPADRPVEAAPPKGQEKLTPELRKLLAGGKDQPERLEVILTGSPAEDDRGWEGDLSAIPGLVIEGQLGPLVSVLVSPEQAPDVAALPIVSTVRLPRSGTLASFRVRKERFCLEPGTAVPSTCRNWAVRDSPSRWR